MPIETTDRSTHYTTAMVSSILPAAISIIDNIDTLSESINRRTGEPYINTENVNVLVYKKLSTIVNNAELLEEIISTIVDEDERKIFNKIKSLDADVLGHTDGFLAWVSGLSNTDVVDLVDLEVPGSSSDSYIIFVRGLIGEPTTLKNEISRALNDDSASPDPSDPMTYDYDRGAYVSSTYSGIRPYDFLDHTIYGVIWEGIDPTTASQTDLDKVAERKEVLDMLQMGTTTVSGKVYNLKADEALPAATIDKIKDDAKGMIAENPSLPKLDALHLALKLSAQLGTVPKSKLTK